MHVVSYLEIKENLTFENAISEIQQESEQCIMLCRDIHILPDLYIHKASLEEWSLSGSQWKQRLENKRAGNAGRSEPFKGLLLDKGTKQRERER